MTPSREAVRSGVRGAAGAAFAPVRVYYFRCLFVGYFERLRSEGGIAWRERLAERLAKPLLVAHTHCFQVSNVRTNRPLRATMCYLPE